MPSQSRSFLRRLFVWRNVKIGLAALVLPAILWWGLDQFDIIPSPGQAGSVERAEQRPEHGVLQKVLREPQTTAVVLAEEQQKQINLKTERVALGDAHQMLVAPGRVAPDETRYAQITPRAAGVIRTVVAVIGQEVRAGDLLATVDSPEVGRARLALYTQTQALEVAQAQADWQETVYNNAVEFAQCMRRGDAPEEVQHRFEHRAIGNDRERLMTAYANYRLAKAALGRKRGLYDQKIISDQLLEQARVQLDVSLASYQALMDQVEYQAKLALTRARQAMRQAETAVRVAREQLRILGVRAGEGTIKPSDIVESNIAQQAPGDGSPGGDKTPSTDASPPPVEDEKGVVLLERFRTPDGKLVVEETPVSTYSLRAPFDGTIIDRQIIVPGVYVDTTRPVFTLANLSTVWVEASVHEEDFDMLTGTRGGQVRFRSPAYPDHDFEGEVIYTGDLVDEKSRTVKLLARAKNPDRMLKLGMFVEIKILNRETRPTLQIPATALLSDGERAFVYVKTGPEHFERREVMTAEADQGRVTVNSGLTAGEEVVTEGAYHIKAKAFRDASEG